MKRFILSAAAVCLTTLAFSQAKPEDTEVYSPVPPVVTPGQTCGQAPSDAIVLFNGDNLDKWENSKDGTSPAGWNVCGDVITVDKSVGDIQTKQSFMDYQLHIEFRIPSDIAGSGQGRGNSGIFLSAPKVSHGYELQVLDNYENKTYVNGQVGSIYKQSIPMANPSRKPGHWQVYDVVWTAPRFNDDGSLKSPATVTAFLNGVLVQNHYELTGSTEYIGKPEYVKHGAAPIRLQAHGDKSKPISYRNIWLREL